VAAGRYTWESGDRKKLNYEWQIVFQKTWAKGLLFEMNEFDIL